MGVPGLWDIIRPTGKQRSLTHLAVVDGFEKNPGGTRGYRIGIDASIWFFHAAYGKEGENPELRTMFFRLARLLAVPFLPLFVFDGPKRPSVKRGKRVGGREHWLTEGMKNIIDAYGFEWHQAPGEAEAELAYLNRLGIIDAVLSDDVDNFLFGAQVVVRNPSSSLTGNSSHPVKNSAGKDDGNHVVIYRASDIEKDDNIALTHGGFILIGLLAGGDYHQAGLPRCGKQIAHGLAKCGFGDTLLQAVRTLSSSQLSSYLDEWRDIIRTELRTNNRGFLGKKWVALASSLTNDFPDLEVLKSYTDPVTSESEGRIVKPATWEQEHSLSKLANCCELYFEWGIADVIVKRFRTVLWHGSILRLLRRGAMDLDEDQKRGSKKAGPVTPTKRKRLAESHMPGTPSTNLAKHLATLGVNSPEKPSRVIEVDEDDGLILKVHSSRTHASTDGLLEYRLEIAPRGLVEMTESGLKGLRTKQDSGLATEALGEDDFESAGEEDDGEVKKKKRLPKSPPDPYSTIRIWIPACIVKMAKGDLVQEFEDEEMRKKEKKEKKTVGAGRGRPKGKARKAARSKDETEVEDVFSMIDRESTSSLAVGASKASLFHRQGSKRAAASSSSKAASKPVVKPARRVPSGSKSKTLTAAASAARQLFAGDTSDDDDPFSNLITSHTSPEKASRVPLTPIVKEPAAGLPGKLMTGLVAGKGGDHDNQDAGAASRLKRLDTRLKKKSDDESDHSDDENSFLRPTSPSPNVARVAAAVFPKLSPIQSRPTVTQQRPLRRSPSPVEVIELSSDSDSPPPKPRLKYALPAPRASDRRMPTPIDQDVIDLT